MPLLPPFHVGRANRAFNPIQEPYNFEKKQKLLPHQMSVLTFHFPEFKIFQINIKFKVFLPLTVSVLKAEFFLSICAFNSFVFKISSFVSFSKQVVQNSHKLYFQVSHLFKLAKKGKHVLQYLGKFTQS